MSTTVIAGKPSNTVGNKDSVLVLRGSSIKIQWGNKFIDLIKNGKINVESDKILKNADSIENVSTDGIYLIEDSVWAVIGGVKIQLSGDSSTTYVSYLIEQETTSEQKNRALTNIGFYYDTYEQARNAGLTKGIIYVQGDNKLYIVNNGLLTEYGTSSITEEEIINELFIKGYSLLVDNDAYITCKNDSIVLHKQLILNDLLQSNGASDSTGFRLYMKGGESYLEIDNIIQRKLAIEKANIYPTKYYQEENIIINIIRDDITEETELTLLHSEKYKEGDQLITYILLDKEVQDNEGLIKVKQVLIPVLFTIQSIEDNIYKGIINADSEDEELVKQLIANIHLLKNKSIFYRYGELPVSRIQDHNYDLFEAKEEQNLENVKARIGTISEIETPLLGVNIEKFLEPEDSKLGIYSNNSVLYNSKSIQSETYISETESYDNITTKIGTLPEKDIQQRPITDFTKKKQGIYSDNAVLDEPNLIKASEYAPTFKKLNNTDIYPKYDSELFIPTAFTLDVSHNKVVPDLEWIKELLDSYIPIGTIIMWNGGKVPPGWAICDGKNGTPDLTNRFIKGSVGSVGAIDNAEITKENKLKLKQEHLPIHSHPHLPHIHEHNEHRHYISAMNIETSNSDSLSMSFNWSDYAWGLRSDSITYVSNVDDVQYDTNSASFINDYSTQGGTTSGGDHTHSVSIPQTYTLPTASTEKEQTSKEEPLTQSDYPNKEINIQPQAYSLIFIMKISNWKDYRDMIIVT